MRSAVKFRGTKIFIYDDLCHASQEKRRAQLPFLKRARSDGKIAYFCQLIIRDRLSTETGGNYGEGPAIGVRRCNLGGAPVVASAPTAAGPAGPAAALAAAAVVGGGAVAAKGGGAAGEVSTAGDASVAGGGDAGAWGIGTQLNNKRNLRERNSK